MRDRALRWLAVALGTSTGLVACATPQWRSEQIPQFRTWDLGSREAFIAAYPELSLDRRRTLLQSLDPRPELLEGRRGVPFPPERSRLGSLEIRVEPGSEPLRAGDHLAFQAILHWADGRAADVTQDAEWTISPVRLGASGPKVRIGCLSEDLVVAADFLGERSTVRVVPVRKPIRNLEIRYLDPSQGLVNDGLVSLQVIATCEDGTQDDVTLAATWTTTGHFTRFQGGGALQIQALRNPSSRTDRIEVRYGNRVVTQLIQRDPLSHSDPKGPS